MAELEYKNIAVEDKKVTLTVPLSIVKTAIASIAYGLVLMVLLEDGFPFRTLALPYLIIFLVSTAAYLWFLDRRRYTTVFDAAEKKITRRSLFRTVAALDFADTAGVQTVSHDGGGSQTEYLSLAMKSNVYGKGYPLTDHFAGNAPELAYLKMKVLPAINKMLSEAGGDSGAPTPAASDVRGFPEHPKFYKKIGNQYVRVSWRRIIPLLVIGFIIAGYQLGNGNMAGILLGVGIMAVTALFVFRITLGADAKQIRVGKAFGFWESRIPFADFADINVTRSTYNGFYVGTSMEMIFQEGKSLQLAHAFFTGNLHPLAEETKQILYAALAEDKGGDEK